MANVFDLFPYSPVTLAEALTNTKTALHQVVKDPHYSFFIEYFGSNAQDARTIVVEYGYVSRSYIDDYASFYATSFGNYERFCKRVHFFSCSLSEAVLEEMIVTPDAQHEEFWLQYIGNIVIKPLPKAIIGATLLKTYSSTASERRFFPCTKEYAINFFGKQLKLQTLAFQEQDPAVGACATTALWSAFQKTCQLFQTPIPSPSAITRSARNSFVSTGRTFPNNGLNYSQIGSAIESVGLEFELWNKQQFFESLAMSRAVIYAYGRMGLPVLLGIDIKGAGNHLVLVTGYKESDDTSFVKTPALSLKAYKINRFYTHDDRVGPFSRLGFAWLRKTEYIETSWQDKNRRKVLGKLKSIIVPLNHKIRLTFEHIIEAVKKIDVYFNKSLGDDFDLYWDIYLDFSNQYKTEMARIAALTEEMRLLLMTTSFPKYIWIAKGYVENECVLEMLFDATEIASADHCMRVHAFNHSLADFMADDLGRATVKKYFSDVVQGNYYALLLEAAGNPATRRE